MTSSDIYPCKSKQPVRDALKDATNDYHNRLNQHNLLAGLTQPSYSLDMYRTLLSAYYILYQALESRLIAFQSPQSGQLDYSQRIKLPWICNDLAFLGIEPIATIKSTALTIPVPTASSIGEYTGVLYVIEGSMLGGQLISRSLAENHGLSGETGACFYHGYGKNTATMWKDFLGFAESIAEDAGERRLAERAACHTFQFFINVLDCYAHS